MHTDITAIDNIINSLTRKKMSLKFQKDGPNMAINPKAIVMNCVSVTPNPPYWVSNTPVKYSM